MRKNYANVILTLSYTNYKAYTTFGYDIKKNSANLDIAGGTLYFKSNNHV